MTVLIIESEELFDWAPVQRLEPLPAGPEDQWFRNREGDAPKEEAVPADGKENDHA